jgi:hypothetical protein
MAENEGEVRRNAVAATAGGSVRHPPGAPVRVHHQSPREVSALPPQLGHVVAHSVCRSYPA